MNSSDVTVAEKNCTLQTDEAMHPDVIYNRFFSRFGNSGTLEISRDGAQKRLVPFYIAGSEARLGLYLSDITEAGLDAAIRFLFEAHPAVKRISYEYCPVACRKNAETEHKNHWAVYLPQSFPELLERANKKSKYNLRRSERLLDEKIHTSDRGGVCGIHGIYSRHCARALYAGIFRMEAHAV